jgi:23S rRNA (uracil1939-C5)-methyltransferase
LGRNRKRRLPREPVEADVVDLAHDGRGVARIDDKVTFVHGGLPGERVMARLTGRNRRFDEAVATSIQQPSPERVAPECPWFGYCGGCALQHLDATAQLRWKQQRLAENLQRIGAVQPEQWAQPLASGPWHYRRRARLSARNVPGKGRVLVGFRELGGRYVADIEACRVLHPAFADRLMSLSALIGALSIPDRVAQVECAAGDRSAAVVLRHLDPLTEDDHARLIDWSRDCGIAVWLQPGGPETVHRLYPDEHELTYRLDAFGLEFAFHPQHFIQVNAEVNQQLTRTAVDWLDPQPDDRVLDLFCGLGNFSLPLATRAGEVLGIEAEPTLVGAGEANAQRNGLGNVSFAAADLMTTEREPPWARERFDGVLLDPPRSGASEILPAVAALAPARIVYVSCDPATLARDAGELVERFGYRLRRAGVADMFPQTAHVESIALFEQAA